MKNSLIWQIASQLWEQYKLRAALEFRNIHITGLKQGSVVQIWHHTNGTLLDTGTEQCGLFISSAPYVEGCPYDVTVRCQGYASIKTTSTTYRLTVRMKKDAYYTYA